MLSIMGQIYLDFDFENLNNLNKKCSGLEDEEII